MDKQNRRNFIKTTTAATGGLLLSKFDLLAADIPVTLENKGFELKILATNWGFNGDVDTFCARVKKEGYDGIEIWWPDEKKDQEELFSALNKYQLEAGFLCGGHQSKWTEHFDYFRKSISAAATNTTYKPLYINCHSGRDYFSYEENKAFIEYTTELSQKRGILICHETHRSRMLYAAPAAKQYFEKNPELKITFDVSHWCNVSESFLQDQPENVNLAIERAEHIHARIGHPQGPQVNDPRAPEWENAVKAHLSWWDKIVERKKLRSERLTVLTEFGPSDYMPAMPYTRQPLSDQWAINVHMMNLLRKRYSS